jgi:hypothetical protein
MIELEIKVTKKQTTDTGLVSMSVQGLKSIYFGYMQRKELNGYRYIEVGIMIDAENIVRKERRRYMRFDESGQAQPGEFYDDACECKSYVIPEGSTIKYRSSLCEEYETIKLKTYQDMLLAINKLDLLVTLENA